MLVLTVLESLFGGCWVCNVGYSNYIIPKSLNVEEKNTDNIQEMK